MDLINAVMPLLFILLYHLHLWITYFDNQRWGKNNFFLLDRNLSFTQTDNDGELVVKVPK